MSLTMRARSLLKSVYNSPSMLPLRIAIRKQTFFINALDFSVGSMLRKYNPADIRLMRLIYCMERTKHLNFPVAECGIGSGYSMVYLLSYLQKAKDSRDYHGFDTFEGFPFIHKEDLDGLPEHRKSVSVVGHYQQFNLRHIGRLAKNLGADDRVSLHQGVFSATIPQLPSDLRFSFVYMDCDLYESYKTCLEGMYGRVVENGIILFDEYEHTIDWPGARRAIDEFFADKPEKPEPLPFGTSWMVRKEKAP